MVGWSVVDKIWVNLGSTNVEGDFSNGSVTSEEFIPNDYEILTIGGNSDILETLSNITLDNYYMTPNGDGINDRFSMRDTSGGEDGGINFVIKDFCDSVHFDKVMDAPNHFGGVYDPTWPGWLFDDYNNGIQKGLYILELDYLFNGLVVTHIDTIELTGF